MLLVLWTDPRLVWLFWWFYGQIRGLCGCVCDSMERNDAYVAVYVVLWTEPRPVWMCMWFNGHTRGLCGCVGGSMDRPEACVAV